MDIEKLIEHIRRCADSGDYPVVGSWAAIVDKKHLREWATALSTLQTENEKLRDEVERQRRSADNRQHLYENAERAYMKVLTELEQVKRERDAAIESWRGFCAKCTWNGKQYLSDGKMDDRCKTCRDNNKCNWEWRGIKED